VLRLERSGSEIGLHDAFRMCTTGVTEFATSAVFKLGFRPTADELSRLTGIAGGRKEFRPATLRPVRSFHSLKVQSLYVVKLKLSLRIRLAKFPVRETHTHSCCHAC
jgi:hypothetical protein